MLVEPGTFSVILCVKLKLNLIVSEFILKSMNYDISSSVTVEHFTSPLVCLPYPLPPFLRSVTAFPEGSGELQNCYSYCILSTEVSDVHALAGSRFLEQFILPLLFKNSEVDS